LRRAAQLDAQQPEVRAALAEALTRAGQDAAAVEQWLEATRLQPRRADHWANLGSALGRTGKPQEAVAALAHALELEPRNPRLLARLAFAEHGAGRIEDAARHLREAAQASAPGEFRHAGALGLVLLQAGRRGEARPWLAQSQPQEAEFAEARRELARLEAEASRGSRLP
jgi:Flp pilus assembly protein TadD